MGIYDTTMSIIRIVRAMLKNSDVRIAPIDLKLNSEKVCIVIDCPINALMAALIGRHWAAVDVIYAIDTKRKDLTEYKYIFDLMLTNLRVERVTVIDYDSALFWGGKKNDILPAIRKQLKTLIHSHGSDYLYYGNCLTNPVALALKRFSEVNHLYHSPSDFLSLIFHEKYNLSQSLKGFVKWLLRRELYKIEKGDQLICSPLNFASEGLFEYIDYREFTSKSVGATLSGLTAKLIGQKNRIMLLLAGDDPEPGDNNPSNILAYLVPHLSAVQLLMADVKIEKACVWIKEHKSYLPLNEAERHFLAFEFDRIGCEVYFVSDFIPVEYRLLPGECILKYCQWDHIISEPSSLLLNVAGAINAVAAVSPFAAFRNADQIGRNNEFLKINNLLTHPCRVY